MDRELENQLLRLMLEQEKAALERSIAFWERLLDGKIKPRRDGKFIVWPVKEWSPSSSS